MDKFGIFNIINTLSDILSKSSDNNKPVEEKKTDSTENTTPKEKKEKTPLNSALINAMNSHDEFVKRVKSKEYTK